MKRIGRMVNGGTIDKKVKNGPLIALITGNIEVLKPTINPTDEPRKIPNKSLVRLARVSDHNK
tara:strand:- start:1640 stop:1828 length:189 start_codon:yes stop_codon:yes gene_type:complete